MKVGLVQLDAGVVTPGAYRHFEKYTREAALAGCDLVIFPELADSGYQLLWKPSAAQQSARQELSRIAKEYGVSILAGLRQSRENMDANTIQVFGEDAALDLIYQKMHLFKGESNDETKHFCIGEQAVVATIGKAKVGLSICFDLRFPQLYRKYALAGADVLVTVAAWPQSRIRDWRLLLQARALENQAYAIGVNYCGTRDGMVFGGSSMVCGPDGQILVEADEAVSQFLICDLDIGAIAECRRAFPVLQFERLV